MVDFWDVVKISLFHWCLSQPLLLSVPVAAGLLKIILPAPFAVNTSDSGARIQEDSGCRGMSKSNSLLYDSSCLVRSKGM